LRAEQDKFTAADILVGQIRQIKPDIVITHTPRDVYMSDHEAAKWIVTHALFCAMLPNYNPSERTEDIRTRGESILPGYTYCLQSERGKRFSLPALYYGDLFPGYDIFGKEQDPTFRVDISSTMGTKVNMLLEHKSQGAWLKAGHGDSDYIKTAREWNKRVGLVVGVEYAEAFLRHKGAPYPRDLRLEKLLGDYVKYYQSQDN